MGEEIRKVVSDLLLRELKDPRLFSGLVSVSAVDVTRDLSYATLYIMVLGESASMEASPERKQEVLDAFESAKGLIRREIARRVQLRRTPELIFKLDTTLEYGKHMDELFNSLGFKQGEDDGAESEEE